MSERPRDRRSFAPSSGPFLAIILGIAIGGLTFPPLAAAQHGPGFERFGSQTRGAYQFGFQPLDDVVLFNETDRTLFFEVAEFIDTRSRPERPGSAWEIAAGAIGRPDILARKIDAGFRTEDGTYLFVEPKRFNLAGRDIALFHVTQRDLERAANPREEEKMRARAFRETVRRNTERGAFHAAELFADRSPGDEIESPTVRQSIYLLVEDRELADDVRDWVWIRERLDRGR